MGQINFGNFIVTTCSSFVITIHIALTFTIHFFTHPVIKQRDCLNYSCVEKETVTQVLTV